RAVKTALPCPVEKVGNLVSKAAERERRRQLTGPPGLALASRVAPQQLANSHLSLRARQQPRQPRSGGHAVRAQQRVAETVEGRRRRLGDRAAEPGRDPLSQLVGGLAAEREDEHLV